MEKVKTYSAAVLAILLVVLSCMVIGKLRALGAEIRKEPAAHEDDNRKPSGSGHADAKDDGTTDALSGEDGLQDGKTTDCSGIKAIHRSAV